MGLKSGARGVVCGSSDAFRCSFATVPLFAGSFQSQCFFYAGTSDVIMLFARARACQKLRLHLGKGNLGPLA